MNPGRIAIVVTNWNLRDYLRECLASIVRETKRHSYEIIVIDNGSTDGSADMVVREFPQAELIRNASNIGYVRASNIGVRRALEKRSCEHVLLINADVVVRDRAVDLLADYLDANSGVGAVGPLLVLPDGRFQAGPAGFKPTLRSAIAYFGFGGILLPRATHPFFVDPKATAGRRGQGRAVPVEWIAGTSLMVRTEVFGRVGLMNENYFLYADDVEWCVRIHSAGLVLHFLPAVRVTHFHGMTVKTVARGFNTRWLDQLFHYVREKQGPVEATFFRATATAGFGLRALLYALQALLPSRRVLAGRKVRETLTYAAFSLKGRYESNVIT